MSIERAIEELRDRLGPRISTRDADRAPKAQSESWHRAPPPDAVAWPETAEEVAWIVRVAAGHGCPVIGWGTGTGLEGHALAPHGGISVDFSRMDRLVAVNAEDMDCTVGPGMTRSALNAHLRGTGLFFPVDPGADASLGGMAATRASGTTAVRYGTMRDNVIALQAVLGTGEIVRTGSRARKSSAGYDLTALLVGSEGTLGLITELTLRLHGQPEAVSAGVCAFPDIGPAVDTVIETIQMGIPMARIEFVDAATARAVNLHSKAGFAETPHLLVEFHGTPAGVAEQAERFGEIVAGHGGGPFRWSDRAEERNALWKMRHAAYYACLALRPGATSVITDICVPISRLAEAVTETAADIAASPIEGPIVGHVGDGNFHAALLVEPGNAAELAAAKALSDRMAERALRLGGTVTGEHGVGMGKRGYMAAEHGAAGWAAMGAIKRALDPAGILNPGKLVAEG
jgi:D-lactate dehydrogenase (cytochrome)